ncbi:hypothetical protein B0H67DRAFT_645920 [Lasiosphaeris hirsuta]|uniref:Uncharacterized protein n=1 Tax=Lasiosphaeris hirsuta TaxID=260670 RepID=A0AA40AI70_9PEZI|nr:hypothetical protein B0H67DRAFT_645920 [Lasiosphaeris hirsuta]
MTGFTGAGSIGLVAATAIAISVQLELLPLGKLIALVQLGLAIGKTIRPLSYVPFECHRIDNPLLDACEDMWISHSTRKLYLACSDSQARRWMVLVVLDLNDPGLQLDGGPHRIEARKLGTPDYTGVDGDGLLSLTGFTGIDLPDGGVRFLVVNNRPAVDPATGKYAANQARAGVNATIEVFERSLTTMRTIIN